MVFASFDLDHQQDSKHEKCFCWSSSLLSNRKKRRREITFASRRGRMRHFLMGAAHCRTGESLLSFEKAGETERFEIWYFIASFVPCHLCPYC